MSNIRHLQASDSSSETPTQRTEENKVSILKNANDKNDTPSHIRHFTIPNELLDSVEEQRFKNYLSMPELDIKMYEDETTITYILFLI